MPGAPSEERCTPASAGQSVGTVSRPVPMASLGVPCWQGQGSKLRWRCQKFQTDPHRKDQILSCGYFDGDTSPGASHQSGWTALVAKRIQQHAGHTRRNRPHKVRPVFGTRPPPVPR